MINENNELLFCGDLDKGYLINNENFENSNVNNITNLGTYVYSGTLNSLIDGTNQGLSFGGYSANFQMDLKKSQNINVVSMYFSLSNNSSVNITVSGRVNNNWETTGTYNKTILANDIVNVICNGKEYDAIRIYVSVGSSWVGLKEVVISEGTTRDIKRFDGLVKNIYAESNSNTAYILTEDDELAVLGTSNNGSALIEKYTGTIDTPVLVQKEYINLSDKQVVLKEGSSKQVTAKYEEKFRLVEKELNLDNLTWVSDNEEIAEVDEQGNITAISKGKTTIRVTDNNTGNQAQVLVDVISNNEKAVAVPDIVYGTNFAILLKEDGTVWTTGQNNYGQQGSGMPTTFTNYEDKQVKVKSEADYIEVEVTYEVEENIGIEEKIIF